LNINKTRFGIFAILLTLSLAVISISAVSANYGGASVGGILDGSSEYAGLSVKNPSDKIFDAEKIKIPSKFKQHENKTKIQVAKGKKISYKAIVNNQGNIFQDFKGVKVKSAKIDFGDKTKIKRGTGWISHTYKTSGKWYLIKVTIINATFTSSKFNPTFGGGEAGNGTITNVTKEYLVYVANKPQLVISKQVQVGYTSQKEQKKGTIGVVAVTVKNVGSLSTKATKIKIWYQDPKKYGKVNPKLKKFTASGKLKALKPGASTVVLVKFKIPKQYAKNPINIKLDSANKNKNQMSRARNLY